MAPKVCPVMSTMSARRMPYDRMMSEPARLIIQNPAGSRDSFSLRDYSHW